MRLEINERRSGDEDLGANDEGGNDSDFLIAVVVHEDSVHPVIRHECLNEALLLVNAKVACRKHINFFQILLFNNFLEKN